MSAHPIIRRLSVVLLLAATGCGTTPGPGEGDAVVLVHGLGRTEQSMMILGQRLRWAGYDVTTVGYASRSGSLEDHVAELQAAVADCCEDAPRIHFVGHSLGGLVIRSFLAESPPRHMGRVVLVAPPSQGSELAEWVLELPLGQEMLGPTGSELGADSGSIPASLPAPSYDLGIITGNRSINPIGSVVIPGPDDGMVGVEESEMDDVPMLVLPRTHAFIMNSRFTADAVLRFLRTGSFEEGEPT